MKRTILTILTVFFFLPSVHVAMAAGNLKNGDKIYRQYCVPCHGQLGAGDGDRFKNEKLDPQPRVHADGTFMNRLPDMRLFMIIKFGGRSMNFSHIMPQWQHILSDEDIIDVISHIRSLAYPLYRKPDSRFGRMRMNRQEKDDSS